MILCNENIHNHYYDSLKLKRIILGLNITTQHGMVKNLGMISVKTMTNGKELVNLKFDIQQKVTKNKTLNIEGFIFLNYYLPQLKLSPDF